MPDPVPSTAHDLHPRVIPRLQGQFIPLVDLDRQTPVPVVLYTRRDVDDGATSTRTICSSVISILVLEQIDADEDALESVLIEVNANCARGRAQAKERSNSGCSRRRLEWVSGSSAHFGSPLLGGSRARFAAIEHRVHTHAVLDQFCAKACLRY
jgi:hypothetical protein